MSASSRVVVCGASNVTRCIATVVGTTRSIVPGPVDLHLAIGHGRSYVASSAVIGRRLPSIEQSALWENLEKCGDDLPLHALVTDVGNDIMYGHETDTILDHVRRCLDRLQTNGARIVMTNLPAERLERITPWQFCLVRAIMFPGHDIDHATAIRRVTELSCGLSDEAQQRGVPITTPDPTWYGLDPIHVRRPSSTAAWMSILKPWRPTDAVPEPPDWSLRHWLTVRPARPANWSLFGKPVQTTQPARRLEDGSTVSLW